MPIEIAWQHCLVSAPANSVSSATPCATARRPKINNAFLKWWLAIQREQSQGNLTLAHVKSSRSTILKRGILPPNRSGHDSIGGQMAIGIERLQFMSVLGGAAAARPLTSAKRLAPGD